MMQSSAPLVNVTGKVWVAKVPPPNPCLSSVGRLWECDQPSPHLKPFASGSPWPITFMVGSGQYCIRKVYMALDSKSSSVVKDVSSTGSLDFPYRSNSSGNRWWTVELQATKTCLNFSQPSFLPSYKCGFGTLLGWINLSKPVPPEPVPWVPLLGCCACCACCVPSCCA